MPCFYLVFFVLGLAFLGRGQLLEWVRYISAAGQTEKYEYYFKTDKPCSPLSGGQQLTLSFYQDIIDPYGGGVVTTAYPFVGNNQ